MIERVVRKYRIEQNLGCSATIFQSCNELWDLHLPERWFYMLGQYCRCLEDEDLCAVYTSSSGLLYSLLSTSVLSCSIDTATDIGITFHNAFYAHFGSRRCPLLRRRGGEDRCLWMLTQTVGILDELVSKVCDPRHLHNRIHMYQIFGAAPACGAEEAHSEM